jgi:DNA-binding transcriptional ArsR family regulator
MDVYDSQAKLFKALMHPARLAILDVLRAGEACVCHMEAALGYRQAYISQQLMVLRDAGLVEDRREGWNIFYRAIKPEIFDVMDSARGVLGQHGKKRVPAVVPACTCPHCTA